MMRSARRLLPSARRALSTQRYPEFETLAALGEKNLDAYADANALAVKGADGVWNWSTYGELGARARAMRGALRALGVAPGDNVAVISKNRPEWAVGAYATYGVGAAWVPMYEQQRPKEWEYILRDSGATVVFASRRDIYESVAELAGRCPDVRHVVCFEDAADGADDGASLAALLARSAAAGADCALAPVAARDRATLIYTSGTTGNPKGVELTHENICSNIKASLDAMPEWFFDRRAFGAPRSLCFLPWAHSYGQTCELHSGMATGGEMYLATDVSTVAAELQDARPNFLLSVPTLYKKVYDGFSAQVAQMSPAKQRLARAAVAVADRVKEAEFRGERAALLDRAQHAVLDRLVLSKVRAKFGGELQRGVAYAAGAATPPEVMKFVRACGITICQGYGLSETAPVVAAESPEPAERVFGSVGRVLDGVRVKVVDADGAELAAGGEGELWVAGPNVMRGYWNNADATAEVIVEEPPSATSATTTRWFRTGDLCELVYKDDDAAGANPFIVYKGRAKEQYKLENGKYVAPVPIEDALCLSRFIAQAIVNGADRPHNIALLVPDWEQVGAWAKEHLGVDAPCALVAPFEYGPPEHVRTLARLPELETLLEGEVASTCASIKRYEVPKAWHVLEQGFCASRGMLTPKLSIKRPVVLKEYAAEMAALYSDGAGLAQAA